jgi:ATP-dependent DNA helicase RecG
MRRVREERDSAPPLEWPEPVDRVRGVGAAAREALAANGITVVGDLLWTLPVSWDDLRAPVGVREAIALAGQRQSLPNPPPRQCVRGVIQSATLVGMRGRKAVRIIVADTEDRGASLDAWWFYAAHGILAAARPGMPWLVVGRVRVRDGKRATMAHPDLVRDQEPGIRPHYPRLGIAPALLRRAVRDAMSRAPSLPDPVPREIAMRESMPEVEPLLRTVHGVDIGRDRAQARRALAERLSWVEAFTRVWQRILAERLWGGARAPVLERNEVATGRLVAALGFQLTSAQRRAIDVIGRDLASSTPMRRLLLGDVGTGKTAVALAASAQCVAAGFQCALLVPTGILAEQYVDAAAPLARANGARLVRVTAGMRAPDRRSALVAIASGAASVAIGTHALLEQDVQFSRLGLVVVDEQQRLGVAQRLKMVQKGQGTRPHLLSLSATPIPRTLALALRGELATTVLDERPQGHRQVVTQLRSRAHLQAVVEEVRATVARGENVFVVCPRIEDDEEDEEMGARARGEQLARELAPQPVVIVHGGMTMQDRVRALRAFRRGDARVLVGTTVVEVGLDVPDATLMVIEGAERFGLAQLHQLRGRVGRGARAGRCLLVHDEPLLDLARRRLEMLATTNDGAAIARADLALRGPGDLGGTRQSGIAEDFEWLDPVNPPTWIERIEADAGVILARDPQLSAPEHLALARAVRRFVTALAVREEAG